MRLIVPLLGNAYRPYKDKLSVVIDEMSEIICTGCIIVVTLKFLCNEISVKTGSLAKRNSPRNRNNFTESQISICSVIKDAGGETVEAFQETGHDVRARILRSCESVHHKTITCSTLLLRTSSSI